MEKADPPPGYVSQSSPFLARYSMCMFGSMLEAKERTIGGAIYRAEVDWASSHFKAARKPLTHAAKGEGNDQLMLSHELEGSQLTVRLTIMSEYTDPIEFDFTLMEVPRTEADTLHEMLDAQERRLQESRGNTFGYRQPLFSVNQYLPDRFNAFVAKHNVLAIKIRANLRYQCLVILPLMV